MNVECFIIQLVMVACLCSGSRWCPCCTAHYKFRSENLINRDDVVLEMSTLVRYTHANSHSLQPHSF